jgi:hypothetical protein
MSCRDVIQLLLYWSAGTTFTADTVESPVGKHPIRERQMGDYLRVEASKPAGRWHGPRTGGGPEPSRVEPRSESLGFCGRPHRRYIAAVEGYVFAITRLTQGYGNQTARQIGPDNTVSSHSGLGAKQRPECPAFEILAGSKLGVMGTEIRGGPGGKLAARVSKIIVGPEQPRPALPTECHEVATPDCPAEHLRL